MATPTRDADLVEDALARVWTEAHREFGPDENKWGSWQVREYVLRLDAARNDPQVVA
ncbi:hypothetical protein [Streptomyces mirabilis]|uniref:hypothetical protein n=1 Tax=Streptomyces mirabilis TaxID=68239 RepID=UPI0036A38B62